MENKSLGNFASAIQPKAGTYLGDVAVVDGLVRAFIMALSEAETGEQMVAEADRMALLFAGENPDFSPIPGWNTRDQLGLYIAKHYGKADPNKPLIEILKTLFLDGVIRFIDAVKAQAAMGDEAGQFRIDVLVEELVAVLTGTWEITYPPEE